MSNNLKLQVLLKAVDQATRPFKSIQNATKSLSGGIRDTQDSIKALDRQAAKIDGFRKTSAQLAVTKEALQKAKDEAAALAIQFRNTERPTNAQAKALEAAKRAAAELQTKSNSLRLSVQQQREALKSAGISTRNLSSEQQRLRTSSAEATASLNRQKMELQRLGQQQEKLNRTTDRFRKGQAAAGAVRNGGAAAFATGSAALYAESRLIAPGMQFDTQMSETQALLDIGKTDPKLAAIRQQARDIGGTTAFSPTDVARTQSTLARSGYDADAVLKSTESTVNLSLASKVDIADAADIVTNMQTAFKIPIAEIQRVSDVMTKGFTKSNTNLLELGEAMKYVAPMAQAAGASIEDTTAMLGIMADNGIKGSMAGTGGSAIFSRLQAPMGQAPEALKELGIKTRDNKGNMLPVIGILQDIDRSFKQNRLGTAQQAEYIKTIFGEEAAKGVIKLIDAAGDGKLQAKRELLMNSGGSAQSVAKIQTDNLDGDLKNLSSAWEDVRIEVFDQQNSALRKLTDTANGWLLTVGKWVKQNPELTQKIVMVTGVLTTLVAGLGLLGLVAWPVMAGFNVLIAGAGLLGTAFSIMSGTIATALGIASVPLAGIIGIVAGVVAIVVGGALLIRKFWEPISAFFKGVGEGIMIALAPLQPMFDIIFSGIKTAIKWFKDFSKPISVSTEAMNDMTSAGRIFGEGLALALSAPLQILNGLRKGIDWVLEKLGVINTEAEGLEEKTPKANAALGGAGYETNLSYSPALGGAGGYAPVTAGGSGKASSQNTYNSEYTINMHPGITKDDALMLMEQNRAREQRNNAAQQRSKMGWED